MVNFLIDFKSPKMIKNLSKLLAFGGLFDLNKIQLILGNYKLMRIIEFILVIFIINLWK